MPTDLSHLGGWNGQDAINRALAATLPTFQDAAPGLMQASEPSRAILLYRAWYDILGTYPNYPPQEIGDCVSFGHAHANDLLQCLEISFGEPSEFRETDTEYIYACSREVAGILGRGDGSYGAAAVKAMVQRFGVVSREQLGNEGTYSGSRAKSWGRTGAPASAKALAAKFKLRGVAKITDHQSAISALWSCCPITICSNQGFSLTRDQDGYCKARGSWAHCMFVAGYDPGKQRYLICQSWGNNSPQGPLYMDQPPFSFWADASVVERNIFGDGDSWALIGAPDFVINRPTPPRFTEVV